MRLGLGLGIVKSAASIYKGILDKFPNAVAAYSTRKLKTSYPTTLPADYGGGAAAAYSLRKVKASYSGNCIDVRRSSDDTTSSIGFSGNELDTTALTTFVGAQNLIYPSEDFGGASWTKQTGITATSNTSETTDPFGGSGAAKIVSTDATKGFYIGGLIFPTSSDLIRSIYLKGAVGGETVTLKDPSGYGDSTVVTLTTEWQRFTHSTSAGITDAQGIFVDNIPVGTIYAFGAQCNEGTTAATYNKTTTGIGGDGHVTRWYSQSDPVDTYTSDFTTEDGFSATPNNTASVLSSVTDIHGTTVNNVLQLNCDDTTSTIHILRNNNPLPTTGSIANLTLKCSFKMLVPSSNKTLKGAALSDGNQTTAGIVSDGKVTEQDRWITFTDVAWTQINQSRLFFMGLDASDGVTFSATAGDKFYIADVVLTQTTDAYNGTDSEQPLVVSGGSVVTENGKAAIEFEHSGTRTPLHLSSALSIGTNDFMIAAVVKNKTNQTNNYIDSSTNGMDVLYIGNKPTLSQSGVGTVLQQTATVNNTDTFLINFLRHGGSVYNYLNAGSEVSTTDSTDFSAQIDFIGDDEVIIQELIVFNSDQSSNRKDIEWNINNHYSIYDQWDRKSCMNVRRSSDNVTQDIGFSGKNINQTQLESFVNDATPVLDDYTGVNAAAAAYSLRKVRTAYDGSAIKVRRSSDDALQDIGFDANGDLDTTALQSFVNTDVDTYTSDFSSGIDGFVQAQVTASSVDGISDGTTSKDDVLKSVLTSGSNNHYVYKNGIFDLSNTYEVSFEYYIPSVRPDGVTPQTIDSLAVRTGVWQDGTYPFSVVDSWQSETIENWSPTANSSLLFAAAVGGDINAIDADGDVYYVKNIVVTQTTADGHVTTWYDQAGSNNASNSSDSEQPLIVEAGDVLLENGKPAIKFDGVDDYFTLGGTNDAGMIGDISVFSVNKNSISGSSVVVSTGLMASSFAPSMQWGINGGVSVYTGTTSDGTTRINKSVTATNYGSQVLVSMINDEDGDLQMFVDGVGSTGQTAVAPMNDANFALEVGRDSGDQRYYFEGTQQELILFASNQSTNRLSIEGNIGRYYNITGYRNGFVTKWYDQSGEYNHAENSAADEQPQIVSNGSMLEENGKAALDFDGTDDVLVNSTYSYTGTDIPFSIIYTGSFVNDSSNQRMVVLGTSSTSFSAINGLLSTVTFNGSSGGADNKNETIATGTFNGTQHLIEIYSNGTTGTGALDSADVSLDTDYVNAMNYSGISLGGFPTFSFTNQKAQEIIIFESDQSGNREDIEKNINTHFKIYS